jgi:hypothetical protein
MYIDDEFDFASLTMSERDRINIEMIDMYELQTACTPQQLHIIDRLATVVALTAYQTYGMTSMRQFNKNTFCTGDRDQLLAGFAQLASILNTTESRQLHTQMFILGFITAKQW